MLILLGADTATFNSPADNLLVHLFQNDFSPNPAMEVSDFVEASFGGYDPITVVLGPCPQSNDPATGDSLMDIRPTSGGWLWEVSTTTGIPQTIYGYYVTDEGGSVLLGAERLLTPVTLTAVNDSVAIQRVYARQIAGTVV